MIVEIRDQLDDLLTGYFRADATPADLASRIARSSRSVEVDLGEVAERLAIRATSHGVSLIRTGRPAKSADAASQRVADQAREEIVEYLRGQRVFFSVPVDLSEAPPFQRRVLEAARQIPFGEARAYGWVAGRIGSPRAVRAVGTALGKNPVPLIVPCHRVWRSDGSLGGYLFGEALKRRLLDLERSTPVLEGSTSTRVVCRVGCVEGRHTRPEGRIVFASVEDACSVGYRPCKVCRPSAAA
jgi:O-6-methylguanine DNA methyltransferase